MEKNINHYETIIIGGGISGLSCARKLKDNKKEFLLISENIGGRILTSDDGEVNYGAYFVYKNYKHFLKFATKKRRIRLWKLRFHEIDQSYPLFILRNIRYIPQIIRLMILLLKFNCHLSRLRVKAEHTSQKTLIENDPFLKSLYLMDIEDFIKENKIESLTYDFLDETLNSCAFAPINKINAFYFLQLTLPFILPFYEFYFLEDKLISDFRQNIIQDTVLDIVKDNNYYCNYSGHFFII